MKTIRTKLLVAFTALIVLITGAIGYFSIDAVKDKITEDTHDHLKNMAAQESKYLEALVQGDLNYVEILAQNPLLIQEEVNLDEQRSYFEAEARRSGYEFFAYVDRAGRATVLDSSRKTLQVGDMDFFKTALSGTLASSDLIFDEKAEGENPIIAFAAPIYNNNQIVAVFFGAKDGLILSDIVGKLSYKETGYAYMVNNDGTTVGHTNTEFVLIQDNDIENAKTIPDLKELGDLTKEMTTRTNSSGEYEFRGVSKIAGYAPVDNTPWVVIFGIETSEIIAESNKMQKILITMIGIAILIGIAVTFVISVSISRPIKRVTEVAKEIADGNFNVNLEVKSKDEVGQLAEAFNQTISQLVGYQGYIDEISESLAQVAEGNLDLTFKQEYAGQFKKLKENFEALQKGLTRTLQNINTAAEQVSIGSSEVSGGAQALASGSTEQASSIEELNASVNVVAQQILENTESIKSASELMYQAEANSNKGNEFMGRLTEAMAEIDNASSQIASITKVIEDIAFQTNILALNAAVEAARAGEAGKGFAVVADEVRNLAAKSAEAAKQTADLIVNSVETVDRGTGISRETATILDELAKGSKEVLESMTKIEEASEDQVNAIEQIKLGIGQVSDVVQNNAATAEENSATSQEMAAQAATLREEIGRFRLSRAGRTELPELPIHEELPALTEHGTNSGMDKY